MQRSARAVDGRCVSQPICYLPGQLRSVCAGAIGQLFRFVPRREVRRITDYCLRVLADTFKGKIRLHEFLFMSNHIHMLLTDVAGCLPDFMRELDSLIARNLNAIRGTTGKNFEGFHSHVIDLDDPQCALEAAVYILANPCKADCVTRSRHWKGTSSVRLRYGEPSSVSKPKLGLWADKLAHLRGRKSARSGRAHYGGRSKSPPTASLTLHPLPGFERMPPAKARQLVLEKLDARERELIVERRRAGVRVVGFEKVERAHYNTMPRRGRVLFDRVPTFAASTPQRREAAAERQRVFRADYHEARDRFIAGERDVVFPAGTWLLVQRYKVRCHPPPT
jgi:hypothetical protein